MVPHLVTALTGPIHALEQRMLDTLPAIERWFRLEWMEHTPPFYAAITVRNADFKVAPVDTDFFPSEWHHLTPAMQPLAMQAATAAIEKICPDARNLLIISDGPTHDPSYLGNLVQLRQIFLLAGLHVRLGSISPDMVQPMVIEAPGGVALTLEPVMRSNGRIGVKDFDPCTILLNKDLQAGIPGILEDLHQQHLLPPLHATWTTRRAGLHCKCYEEIARRFGKLIGIDPWLIQPMFDTCHEVDLRHPESMQRLAEAVDTLLLKIRRKYKEYGIKEKPFLVLKAHFGGSTMGLMPVRDAKALPAMLERAAYGGVQTLVLQEGLGTIERLNDAVAEPVVYLMDRYVVGGFYRVHAQRGVDENLSAADAGYVPLAFGGGTQLPPLGERPGASDPNRFYMYGVVGRLAMLAGSYELEATDPEALSEE